MFGTITSSSPAARSSRLRLAALVLGAGVCLTLAGCGSSGDTAAEDQDGGATASEETESDAAAEEAAAEDDTTADDASAGASEVSVTIDGSPVDIADPTVVCQEMDGDLTIAVGSATGADGIGAVLSGGDSPTVTSVALGSVDGTAMGWAEGAPGEAEATKDGSTYEITGSMMAVDAENPASRRRSRSRCPSPARDGSRGAPSRGGSALRRARAQPVTPSTNSTVSDAI